jgi:nucleotide-binding universal stress UspA family protein
MASQRLRFQMAINDFHRARQQASLEGIVAKFTGRSAELLSFEEVANKLKETSRVSRGVKEVPVDAIVGSVGRYNDFTRTFLPKLAADAERWAGVKSAKIDISMLPPVDLYQVGDAYFVLDGNHRVSIARVQGNGFIDARVTEVRTLVPLSPEDRPDELILKAEHAAFLAYTRLDRLRPKTDFTVSAPGAYAKMENLIEVHRFCRETVEEVECSDEEAVCRWHDEDYLPMVEAIREQGILRYFPGRTETDFYIWLATNQAALRNEFGWHISPESAASKLASRYQAQPPQLVARMRSKILDLVVPDQWRANHHGESWSQERTLARYSARLFEDILVPLSAGESGWQSVLQANDVARLEGATIHALSVEDATSAQERSASRAMRDRFKHLCQESGVTYELVVDKGDLVDSFVERALLADLVVVDRSFATGGAPHKESDMFNSKTRRVTRPVLIVPGKTRSIERVLLAYDDLARAREALFVATYMAEQWHASLVVVAAQESKGGDPPSLEHARRYLEMHEVDARFVLEKGVAAEAIVTVAQSQDSDLIIMGSRGNGRVARYALGDTTRRVLDAWDRLLIVCS